MPHHDYTLFNYRNSPLHTGISQLLESLDGLKTQIANHETPATPAESKYLNQFYQLWSSLHYDLLPIYSKGGAPGISNLFAARQFKNKIDSFTPKSTINTPLDHEIAKRLHTFIHALLNKHLIEIAPFLNPNNIDITVLGYNIGKIIRKKMQKIGVDDLLLPNHFQEHLLKKYNALTNAINAYSLSSLEPKSEVQQSSFQILLPKSAVPLIHNEKTNDITATKITHPMSQSKSPKTPPPLRIKGLTPLFKQLITISQIITKIGRHEKNSDLIHLSKQLQQRIKEFERLYKKPGISLRECSQFKAHLEHLVNQIDEQITTVKSRRARSLWAIFSSNIGPILNLITSVLEYIASPIITISNHRNSLFAPSDDNIINNLRQAVSKIPETGLSVN